MEWRISSLLTTAPRAATLASLVATVWSCSGGYSGFNPHPVRLSRPAVAPLSPVAEIGRAIFFDVRLSASGTLSCATCHHPDFAYGPPNDLPAQLGGLSEHVEGARAVPSLRYADRAPTFGIGPDVGDGDAAPLVLPQLAARSVGLGRPRKASGTPASPPPLVPRGGLLWDGRIDSLQTQAALPLLNPAEMANVDYATLADKFRSLGYADRLARALGRSRAEGVSPRLLDEALFALARFEFEDPSFHPYSSRYDRWLEGNAALTAEELRGLRVFEDPAKGNCAACHLDGPDPNGRPPMFTDWQYEALGVPRNARLAANRDPGYRDLGVCGPFRADLEMQPQWCGMFRTPALRNVATRRVFFHNGVYHTLDDVMRFYNFRDTRPELVFPVRTDGHVEQFDDVPHSLRGNVDMVDAPFGRKRGDEPPMTEQEMRDVISFLATLTDERAGCEHCPAK